MICAEADSYWCLCKLLDGIQDHYTYAQPGIQRTVFRLKELVRQGPASNPSASAGLRHIKVNASSPMMFVSNC